MTHAFRLDVMKICKKGREKFKNYQREKSADRESALSAAGQPQQQKWSQGCLAWRGPYYAVRARLHLASVSRGGYVVGEKLRESGGGKQWSGKRQWAAIQSLFRHRFLIGGNLATWRAGCSCASVSQPPSPRRSTADRAACCRPPWPGRTSNISRMVKASLRNRWLRLRLRYTKSNTNPTSELRRPFQMPRRNRL